MSIIDRAIEWVSPGWARSRARDRLALRSYQAAEDHRLRDSRRLSSASPTAEVSVGRDATARRARQAVRDDGFAARIVDIWAGNAVGAGITTAWKDDAIGAVWREWADTTACDFEGRKNLGAIEELAVRSMVESGDSLVRLRPALPTSDNPVGLTLQVIEGDHIAWDKTGTHEGRIILNGVEIDAEGRIVAYWLYPRHPGEFYPLAGLPGMNGREAIRVERRFVLHLFRQRRPGQIRDVSWLATALGTLADLGEYEGALLMKAKIEACLAAIVSGDEEETVTGQTPGSVMTDSAGNPIDTLEPGMILHRRGAGEVSVVNPSGGGSHSTFARRSLERAAVGSGLTYDQVSGDLTGANYSSLRAGKIEFRRGLDQVQWNLIVPQLADPIAKAFHQYGVLAGLWPAGKVPERRHTPPPMEMVDPLKDTAALIAQVRAGFVPQDRAVEMFGFDFAEVVAAIRAANQALDDAGITLDTDPRRVAKAGSAHDAAQVAAIEIAATGAASNRPPKPAASEEGQAEQ